MLKKILIKSKYFYRMESIEIPLPPSPSNGESNVDSSIPDKLKRWYSHSSFRAITLSVLSVNSVILTFIALFTGIVDHCEAIGFVLSLIMLFAPSPLSYHHH
jgi:hypothetical protein